MRKWITSASVIALGLMASTPVLAQQTTGTPGSPDTPRPRLTGATCRFPPSEG